MSQRARELLEEFAQKIEAEVKQEMRLAIEGIGLGLGSSSRHKTSGKDGTSPSRAKGEKREPAELEALGARFLAFVSRHPNMRVEEINRELLTSTRQLALPIKKLLAEGRIVARGRKRSTTYSIGSSSKRKAKKRTTKRTKKERA